MEVIPEDLKKYVKHITNDITKDYGKFLKDLQASPAYKELEGIVSEYNISQNKEKFKYKLFALQNRFGYKYGNYSIPICKTEDYKLFINNLEALIENSLKCDERSTLILLTEFLHLSQPIFQKERRLPSEVHIMALQKSEFEEWVKKIIKNMKDKEGYSKYIMKYEIHKKIKDPENKFFKSYKEIKEKLLKDDSSLKKDVETLANNIKNFYEAFHIISGLFIGLFDLINKFFDDNIEQSYFGDKFHPDDGFYSRRKIMKKNRLIKDLEARNTLKKYFNEYGCKGFQDFYEWFMKSVKPIRLTMSHHASLLEQDKIKEGRYKVMYKEGVKAIPIGFLQACESGLASFLSLILMVVTSYFFDNINKFI